MAYTPGTQKASTVPFSLRRPEMLGFRIVFAYRTYSTTKGQKVNSFLVPPGQKFVALQ